MAQRTLFTFSGAATSMSSSAFALVCETTTESDSVMWSGLVR